MNDYGRRQLMLAPFSSPVVRNAMSARGLSGSPFDWTHNGLWTHISESDVRPEFRRVSARGHVFQPRAAAADYPD